MAALRVLWAALVSLYEETLALVAGNLVWIGLNVPAFLVLLALALPFAGSLDAGGGAGWLLGLIAWLLLLLPTPGSVALGGLARVAASPDVPHLSDLWQTLRRRWRLALGCGGLSLVVGVLLLGNTYFYAVVSTGWLRFAAILWLYGTLFWLSLHVYLVPLLNHVPEPRLLDVYRRAAFIALGHPGLTLALVIAILLVGVLTVVFVPAYVLAGGSYVALVQAHALREIRRRHGDLVAETEEERGW